MKRVYLVVVICWLLLGAWTTIQRYYFPPKLVIGVKIFGKEFSVSKTIR